METTDAHKGQYRSHKKNVSVEGVFEIQIDVFRTFAPEAGTDTFDDTAIEAQTTWFHSRGFQPQGSVHLLHHALPQTGWGLRRQDHDIAQGLDTEGKADAIRVQMIMSLGGLKHDDPNGIMGQKEGIQFF